MKLIKPYTEILSTIDGDAVLKTIESVARTCYKSEDLITDDSAKKMVSNLLRNGHEAMIEHGDSITIKFICDRGVSHEIVRHRLFSFAQESTRYCNYGTSSTISVWIQKNGEWAGADCAAHPTFDLSISVHCWKRIQPGGTVKRALPKESQEFRKIVARWMYERWFYFYD